VDRALGGGLVPGSVVLLAGAPGIGKSTLLLQLASGLSRAGSSCLIASGEESLGQVAARAGRLGIDVETLRFVPGRNLDEVLSAAQTQSWSVLMVDSIQTIRDAGSDSLAGGTGQVRACADALIGLAKERGVTVVLVGHVTKDGDLAGPRTLEHAVDAVLMFEGDPRSGLRILAAGKNRFGPEGETAWFEMTAAGVSERPPGPRLGDGDSEPGSAAALALAGRRAFAVDVQALVVSTDGPPRRQVAGLDPRRFHIVAAVAGRTSPRLRLTRSELYGASAGGVRLDDPGADLAIAAALASAATGVAPPSDTAFVGELSLTGTVRPVPGMEQRLSAAAAAGISTVICPEGHRGSPDQRKVGGSDRQGAVRAVPVRHLREALAWALGGSSKAGRSPPRTTR
jgi:DNA repair protein RadA/Sms